MEYKYFNPENDGLSKIDHVKNMLLGFLYQKEFALSDSFNGSMVCSKQVNALYG